MRAEVLHDESAFRALKEPWDALCNEADVGLFLSHRWLEAWWRAYRGVDELWVVTAREAGELRAAWPLHLTAPRSGAIKVAALRLLGDLGGAQRSFVCRPADVLPAAQAFVEALERAKGWDVLEVPVVGRRVAEALERAVAEHGRLRCDRIDAPARAHLDLPPAGEWDELERARRPARLLPGSRYRVADDVRRGLDELLRLVRREWAAREAASPAQDPQAVQFLEDIVPELAARGDARVGLLEAEGWGVQAADLVVRDGDRQVQILRGIDPEHLQAGAGVALALESAKRAAEAGARTFELVEDEPQLKAQPGRAQHVRLWNATTVGRLHHGYTSLKDAMRASSHVELRALDRLREAAPEVVQRAVSRVATYVVLHLYRGELFTRHVRESGDVTIELYRREDFEAMTEAERDDFVARLDLQPSYCRQKWARGDTVVLARVGGRPSGIVWCARAPVHVPDIGREVRPAAGECYIHDVYVHPDERGRQLAPAMLDFLARELRRRDVYRAWALIERSNAASVRAFERAAYAPVADVVYARMGLVSRLSVRPPDPEARSFLGLP